MGGALMLAGRRLAARRSQNRNDRLKLALWLVGATIVIGLALTFLSTSIFAQLDVTEPNYHNLNAWVGISIGANLLIALAATFLVGFVGKRRSDV